MEQNTWVGWEDGVNSLTGQGPQQSQSKWKSEECVSKQLREDISVYSECSVKSYAGKSRPKAVDFNLMRSKSDPGGSHPIENLSNSDQSMGDSFQVPERTNPVVIFWEKSDKQHHVETSVIVKFSLPTGEVFTHAFSKDSKVAKIKQSVADIFKIPVSMLQLEHHNIILEDCVSIADITIERFGTVSFQLSSQDPIHFPLIMNNVYPDIPTNDVLTVIVQKDECVMKQVIVEIENRSIKKPFLGGYRHKKTGLEYHHAFSQTAPRPPKANARSRVSQTYGVSKMINTSREKCIQTNLEQKEDSEKILYGNPQRPAQIQMEEEELMQEKVLLLQRNLRSWLVRKMMIKMKEEYKRCIEWERNEHQKRRKEKNERKFVKEMALKYPKSRGDFELMYNDIELWRLKEIERLNTIESTALRKAELCSVLEREVKMINAVENHRIRFQSEAMKKKQEKLLEDTATPVQWKGACGQVLEIDSLGTQRARKLRDLYQDLLHIDLPTSRRIQLLSNIKQALLEHKSSLTPELTSLLDRECQVLIRDIRHADLATLRTRIQYLFLEYIKDPSVNPQAKKFIPAKVCRSVQTYKCISCNKVVPYFKFPLHSKSDDFKKCTQCCWLQRVGGSRIDVSSIRHIMNAVRRDELKQSCYTSVALVMQEQDFYHLIVNIWLAHSAIGGSGNLEELRLGRWDFTDKWSPWNCILLTSDELKAHLRFSNPGQIYSLSFVKRIKQRHQIGRIHFSELASYCFKTSADSIQTDKIVRNVKAAKVCLDETGKST